MTGNAPTVNVALDQPRYPRGATITATPSYSDADNRVAPVSLDGPAPDGLAMHLDGKVIYTDAPDAVWYWASNPSNTVGRGVSPLRIAAPARSDRLVLRVTDRQGHVVIATADVTVQTTTLVGVDVWGSTSTAADIDAHLAQPGGIYPAFKGYSKVFFGPGQGLPTWDGATAHIPAPTMPHLCFRDFPTQAQWTAWLDSVPAPLDPAVPFAVTWDQEGDRKDTPAYFVSQWETLVAWSAGHKNRDRILLVADLTWYWERYKDSDNYAQFIPKGVDVLGVDVYPGGTSNWTDPGVCLAAPTAAAKAAGLRLAICECGVVVPANPTPGDLQARANWYAGLISAAQAAGVLWMSVWCAYGAQAAGTGGFHLVSGDPGLAVITGAMTV